MRDIAKYAADYVANYTGFEVHQVHYRRQKTLETLAIYPHSSILEVGCGLEPLFPWVDEFESYALIEPAAEFVERARDLTRGDQRVEIYEGFLETSEGLLREREYDFIVVSSLLHEVTDPDALLVALRELCHSHTMVHINVPNAKSLHNLLGTEMGIIESPNEKSKTAELYQRKSTFDLDSLAQLVGEVGFQVFGHGSYFLKPFTHSQMQALLDQGIISRDVLDALYAVVEGTLPNWGSEIYVNVAKKG